MGNEFRKTILTGCPSKQPALETAFYVLKQWSELNVFTTDGAVPLDNNTSEREMKRIVLNRKNSLFVGNE
jgi:transposase